jgi:ornithine cyclodeaminase/alanine dehydrogenase-like protein (mu-crystallin family)
MSINTHCRRLGSTRGFLSNYHLESEEIGMIMQEKKRKILYLNRRDVERVGLPMGKIIDAVEDILRDKSLAKAFMPPKHWLPIGGDSFFAAMSSYSDRLKAAVCKWQGGFPQNPSRGLPFIQGLLTLSDMRSGTPMAIMDSTWITAMRTAAATAVAAKYLAVKDPQTVAILGCGLQGRTNLEALHLVFSSLERVHAYDINDEALRNYKEEMTRRFQITVLPFSNPKEAMRDADIVVTAGPILKKPKPAIGATWLKRGGFAMALDYDSYWKPQALKTVDKFCTDDVSQILHLKSFGYFLKVPPIYAEIGDIISGKKKGRESKEERIVSMHLGVSVEDLATAIRIYRKAKEQGIGKMLHL